MKPAVKRYLENIYYDPEHPGSFSGVDRLHRAVKSEGKHKISRKRLEEFLRTQETYGVHRKSTSKFPRPKVVVSGVGIQADLSALARFNDGYKFLLVHVDVFSKYARTVPLRSKTAGEVTRKVFESGGKTSKVRTDKGAEFNNKTLRQLFEKEGVEHFVTQNVPKASVEERLIKSLKSKYFKYMTHFKTFRYLDIVDDTTQAYNRSYHRSIKTRPVDVTESNEAEIFTTLYRNAPVRGTARASKAAPEPFKYKRGDYVRVSVSKKPFDREYQEKWTYEIYKVKERDRIQSIPVYTLKDFNGKTLAGRFYTDQLQPTTVTDQDTYKIEKVIKSRKRKGHPKEVFVKWYGWDSSHNSWLPEKRVEDIRKGLEQRRKGK